MSSDREQSPLDPNDPEHYPPLRLRERAKSGPSLSQGAGLEPLRSRITLPAAGDIQLKNAVPDALWKPLDPEVINASAGLTRELDRRGALFHVATRLAAAVVVVTVVVLLFVFMKPGSRQSDADSTSSETTGSTITALPLPGQGDVGSKPAIAEFQALLGSAPPSQPATPERSQLQQFLQWRQKANTTETSR
jgi:hypothetical protein